LRFPDTSNCCNSPDSLHLTHTTENLNTTDEADFRKKGVRFFGEEKGVHVIRSWKRMESFLLLSMFLHPVGKRESALFFLLASVFPTGFSLQRF